MGFPGEVRHGIALHRSGAGEGQLPLFQGPLDAAPVSGGRGIFLMIGGAEGAAVVSYVVLRRGFPAAVEKHVPLKGPVRDPADALGNENGAELGAAGKGPLLNADKAGRQGDPGKRPAVPEGILPHIPKALGQGDGPEAAAAREGPLLEGDDALIHADGADLLQPVCPGNLPEVHIAGAGDRQGAALQRPGKTGFGKAGKGQQPQEQQGAKGHAAKPFEAHMHSPRKGQDPQKRACRIILHCSLP